MKSFFNIFFFSIIILAISSCSLTKNLNPQDQQLTKQKKVDVPCMGKDSNTGKYFRGMGVGKSPSMNLATKTAKANAAADLQERVLRMVETYFKAEESQSSNDNVNFDYQQEVLSKIELTTKNLSGFANYPCGEMTSDGKLYYYYSVIEIPVDKIFSNSLNSESFNVQDLLKMYNESF